MQTVDSVHSGLGRWDWSWIVVAVTLLIVALGPKTSQAQTNPFGEYDMVGASYHKFLLPGESAIAVLVMGSVGGPGIYEVGRGTDLGRLVAITGAQFATETAKITLRLYRESSGVRNIIYEASAEDFLANPGAYPELVDGDVLTVESVPRAKFTWRDGLAIVTGAAALTLAIERLSRAF